MLNYAYIVEAGRLAKALAVPGLCLSIGFLHSDKKGRNSLVWDAIEPLRPSIGAKVFAFIEAHEFARRDFPQSGYNVHRLSQEVRQLLLHRASLPAREIEQAVGFDSEDNYSVRRPGTTVEDRSGGKEGRAVSS